MEAKGGQKNRGYFLKAKGPAAVSRAGPEL
jgi:hypothetical protein